MRNTGPLRHGPIDSIHFVFPRLADLSLDLLHISLVTNAIQQNIAEMSIYFTH